MAEGRDQDDQGQNLPERGRVSNVCKQWLVHEDGALANRIQGEDFDFHYGLNRYNRRTVRQDIPVARLVQSDEEVRQQEERMQELLALRAQAEEDELVARRVSEDISHEELARLRQVEIQDEEYAREMQNKEKKKYERYLQKKREKQLAKERDKLEKQLALRTEEARLLVNQDGSGEVPVVREAVGVNVSQNRRGSDPNNQMRVTPSGRIEDDGDFSDFYMPASQHLDEREKKYHQESQDEELARLLQEQEHKRSKAEVDKNKMKEIEEKDGKLAKVMQEQEKIKVKKAKQKRKDKEERNRKHQEEQCTLGSNAVFDDEEIPLPVQGHRYRRDSYTRSIETAAGPEIPSPEIGPRTVQEVYDKSNIHTRPKQELPSSQNSYAHSQRGRDNDLHSAQTPQQNRGATTQMSYNIMPNSNVVSSDRDPSPRTKLKTSDANSQDMRDSSPNVRHRSRETVTTVNSSVHDRSNSNPRQYSHDHVRQDETSVKQRPPSLPSPEQLPPNAVREVERWLGNAAPSVEDDSENHFSGSNRLQYGHSVSDQPSSPPPGAYRKTQVPHRSQNGRNSPEPCYAVSAPMGTPNAFNIATAIDPTYHRRQHELREAESTQPVSPIARMVQPHDDIDLEWEPGLRGSLRRPKGHWNPLASQYDVQDSTTSTVTSVSTAGSEDSGPVLNPWQPVQGQKRSNTDRAKKSRKPSPQDGKRGSCKQQ